eukprot:6703-Heterococcus_DN1.PRE.4
MMHTTSAYEVRRLHDRSTDVMQGSQEATIVSSMQRPTFTEFCCYLLINSSFCSQHAAKMMCRLFIGLRHFVVRATYTSAPCRQRSSACYAAESLRSCLWPTAYS